MKVFIIILLILYGYSLYCQSDDIIPMQIVDGYKTINSIDSIRLTSGTKQYFLTNLKANEKNVIIVAKIPSGTYDITFLSKKYDTVLYKIRTCNAENFKYVFYLNNKNNKIEQIQMYNNPELTNYIFKNLHYPDAAKNNKIEGKVLVSFVITTTGAIDSVEIVRSVNPLLDDEVLRLFKSAPNITPVLKNGIPTNIRGVMPINFKFN